MYRPYLVHFLAVATEHSIAIRAALSLKDYRDKRDIKKLRFIPHFPFQSIYLMKSRKFSVEIEFLDETNVPFFSRTYETDNYGTLSFKIPCEWGPSKVKFINVFEVGMFEKLGQFLGTFLPLNIINPKKIIITDFDKTLVDTRYSTTKEVYRSLTRPVTEFPTVDKSVELMKEFMNKQFCPFILSASPHFYEAAIRDWLYQHNIYSAGLFLKDYRKVFDFFERELTTKDIKKQGLYKLNHLLDIIFMVGIPEKIILMGDNFESDPLIYTIFEKLINRKVTARDMWLKVRGEAPFMLNRSQKSQILNKMYQLSSMASKMSKDIDVQIYIRKTSEDDVLKQALIDLSYVQLY